MLRLAAPICWLASPNVTGGGHFIKARGCGQPVGRVVSSFLKATSTRHLSDQSRLAADAPGRGWTIHIFGKFTSCDRDALGDRVCNSKADVE